MLTEDIADHQQLAHAGGQGHLGGLAGRAQARMTGLARVAATVAMYSTARTAARPPAMRRWPRQVPLSRTPPPPPPSPRLHSPRLESALPPSYSDCKLAGQTPQPHKNAPRRPDPAPTPRQPACVHPDRVDIPRGPIEPRQRASRAYHPTPPTPASPLAPPSPNPAPPASRAPTSLHDRSSPVRHPGGHSRDPAPWAVPAHPATPSTRPFWAPRAF